MTELGAPLTKELPTELRETRLRTTIDELRWQRDSLRRENKRLRDRLERHAIKLKLLRDERNLLDSRIRLMERETAKGRR